MDENIDWIKVAASESEIVFNSNDIAEVTAGERKICIAKFQKTLFAFTNKCPHASGLFINGYIDAVGNVVCPLHRYKFNMRNGKNVTIIEKSSEFGGRARTTLKGKFYFNQGAHALYVDGIAPKILDELNIRYNGKKVDSTKYYITKK